MRETDLILRPVTFGPLKDANCRAHYKGPCGDTMEFWIRVEDSKLLQCTFTTDGCETSSYCANAIAEDIIGKTTTEITNLKVDDFAYILKELDMVETDCIKLALITLQKTVSSFVKQNCGGQCKSCSISGCDSRSSDSDEDKDEDNDTDKSTEGEAAANIPTGQIVDNSYKSKEQQNIIVLSGKGGVGKSTVAVNLATKLAQEGNKVGLIDIDFHGPSIPVMLGIKGTPVESDNGRLKPYIRGNLKVMSIGFLLSQSDAPVIWRGPMKMGAIKQFLDDVDWGLLDYLVIDSPPGTGDEPLSICQALEGQHNRALIVTTPQEVAASDVRRSVNFCKKMNLPIAGILENMSGFTCPHCNETTNIFSTGGGEKIANTYGIAFLGALPVDAHVGVTCDEGLPFVDRDDVGKIQGHFNKIVDKIIDFEVLPEK